MKPLIVSLMCLILLACSGSDSSNNDNSYIISDDAKAFADAHWSEEEYNEWFIWWEYWFCSGGNPEWIFPDPHGPCAFYFDSLSKYIPCELPDTNNDLYYEMIGQHDQFIYGWDDINSSMNQDDSTLAPAQIINLCEPLTPDTPYFSDAYFENWIGDIISGRRLEYLDLLESGRTNTTNPLKY